MSAARLLILGVLQFKSPAHGYEIRRELETWHAEQWAHIAYGSIYFALNKMADESLVEAVSTDQIGKRSARTLFINPFQVALTFMNKMPREELLLALRYRADRIRAFLAAFQVRATHVYPPDTPATSLKTSGSLSRMKKWSCAGWRRQSKRSSGANCPDFLAA